MNARYVAASLSAVVIIGGLPACANDRILPVDAHCGNLEREANEECDVESEGCQECRVVVGFACDDTACATICGDEIVAGDEECDPPDALTCDSACRSGEKAEACDMTGYWVARETDFSIDDVLNQVQTSSNYYAYRIEQVGDTFEVAESLNCGIVVSGTADVNITPSGTRALMHLNPQDRTSARGPRRGTFVAEGDGCAFSMDRHYAIRGLEERFLPIDFIARPDLASLEPLPYEDNPEMLAGEPFGQNSEGAVDTDGDGALGLRFVISGNASGARNTVQRDWTEYFPNPQNPTPAYAIEFSASSRFANQENIMRVTGCPLIGCGVLLAGSVPATNLNHRVLFRYLGRELSDPRVARVFVAPMRADLDQDEITCANLRAALPHDPAKE